MMRITVEKLNEVLENGPYAWPGGYPIFFICADGEPLSFQSVEANREAVVDAITNPGTMPSWEVSAYEINWEDENLYCSHSHNLIECAYPSDTEE
jgi:hypothetical protein